MNFDKINPIVNIDGNAILTRLGDISLCFKIELPETNTVPLELYNEIHTALLQMFLVLPENVLVHRQDIFLKKKFDSSVLFNENEFFSNSLKQHFDGRDYLDQNSYLYITLLNGFGFNRSIGASSYFKKNNDKNKFDENLNDFIDRVKKAIISISDLISVSELKEEELRNLIANHFNGFEDNKVSSPFFHPEFTIGKKHFAIYGLDEDVNQKDGDISLSVVNSNMSSEITKMYESYMSKFGHSFSNEHVINSFIFYDNQSSLKKKLSDNKSKLNIIKSSKDGSASVADRVTGFLENVENENVKVIRTHFNITVFNRNKEKLYKAEQELQGAFSKCGIVPTEYNYLDYPYLYLANTPGCGGHLPKEYSFISILDIGLIYTLFEGAKYKNDSIGILYSNRTDNIPFKLDTFYKPYEDKLIDNRNYFVIAPSGGGKSFSSRSRLYQQYNMGFDQVIINIGGDDKLVKLINKNGKNEALYIEYVDGQTLPINPFYIDDYVNNDKVEFLTSFIWLLWGGKDEIDNNKQSILYKVLYNFYGVDLNKEYLEGKGYKIDSKKDYSIQDFYEYLVKNKKNIEDTFQGDKSMFNVDSLILNLEKFAKGSFKYLFSKGKPELAERKKYIEFELDNIKDHPFLFPIFSMLISDLTFNTMWTSDGPKDFFIDECWKILEKPGMALLLKYLFKTIRKFDGAVGIAVQQITDLAIDPIIEGAILGNCAIKYLLRHKNVLDQVPLLQKKLSLKDSEIAMLLSIQNKTNSAFVGDRSRYTEQLLIMGADFAKVVRIEVSPELAVIYDSEKTRLRKFNKLYESTEGDIEKTVIEYLKN